MEVILAVVQEEDFDTKLKFLWRTVAVISILLQNLSVTYNIKLLRNQIYELTKESEFNINLNICKKKSVLKLSSFLCLILTFLLLFFIRKMVLADTLTDNVNNSIEDVIPSLISNPVVSQVAKILIFLSINHLTITKFGNDCVLIYMLVLTEGHAEHLKVATARIHIKEQSGAQNYHDTEREMVALTCTIKYCILLHQRVIR